MFPNKLVSCITNVKWRNSILFSLSTIVCCAVGVDVWLGSAHSAGVPSEELGETPRGTQRCLVWSGMYHAGSSRSYKVLLMLEMDSEFASRCRSIFHLGDD